jgi:hypothetical protein
LTDDDRRLIDEFRRLAKLKSPHQIDAESTIGLTTAKRLKKPGYYPKRLSGKVRESVVAYNARLRAKTGQNVSRETPPERQRRPTLDEKAAAFDAIVAVVALTLGAGASDGEAPADSPQLRDALARAAGAVARALSDQQGSAGAG